MLIGGIQKNSFIDFPSKISCVVFTSGCNFNCPYCHNPELAKPPPEAKAIPSHDILRFLKERKSFLDGVVISGGEPTLQKNLFEFCAQVKSIGYPVKLDTNGSRPNVIARLIKRELIDYIAMDVKTAPERYVPVITRLIDPSAVQSSIQLILASGIAHEFRTTCVKSIVDENDIRTIARLIRGADLFVLQKVRYNGIAVLHPEFFKRHEGQYTDRDMELLQSAASGFVKNCRIRG